MPTLNWIGKEKIVKHDQDVPFRLLKKDKTLSLGVSENLIVEGDNLEALKALMPHYQGKVKCIYIDPPYNTGNEKWVYNDNVNSSKIKEWIGKAVGPEGEDLTRHDKWLCMMYPRLKLLRDLLHEDGAIFISIDDNEHCNLKMVMDEIFGEQNFVANIIWQKKYAASNDAKGISAMHDFIVVYQKTDKFVRNLLPRTEKQDKAYKYDDGDGRGLWRSDNLLVKSFSESYVFPVINPKTGEKFLPPEGSCWRASEKTIREWVNEKRIFFGKNGTGAPQLKRYLSEVQSGIVPTTWWSFDDAGHNDEANKELRMIFDQKQKVGFETPKPSRLIKRILQIATSKDDLILDSFAGSGTTAQAVLELNKEDGGNRKFILVEMENKIAKEITAERVRRVSKTLGGSFEYVTLGDPLFNKSGALNQNMSFKDFASYIYFTETHTNIDPKKIKENFIGEYNGKEFYLLFKDNDKNVLNRAFLSKLKKSKLSKIVYADKCLLDQMLLDKHGVTFRQIPYSVKTY